MDSLAAILFKEKKLKELEQLATRLMSVSEDAPEPWVAMGYYCFLTKKGSRAVYFAHRACMLANRSVEALILKGNNPIKVEHLSSTVELTVKFGWFCTSLVQYRSCQRSNLITKCGWYMCSICTAGANIGT